MTKSLRKNLDMYLKWILIFCTIEENICYSSSKIDRKKFATANAVIDEEIKKFPNEYKTKIGEGFNYQVVKTKNFNC